VAVVEVFAAGMLFDMDGVLVSSINSVNRCWRRWAKHYGVAVGDDYEIPHGVRAVEVMDSIAPHVDKVEGLRLIEDMEIDDVHDIITLPGARTLLESLPHERWSIVTSATLRLLEARLRAAGLPQPDRIISADLVERGKPDPQPYLMGAARLGVDAKDCLVFEDAPSGVKAGVAAGARVVGVLGTTPEATLREMGATWVVPTLEAVKATVVADGLSVTIEAI
jgi:mannitol-1-/sugar-/sorbitol-6-phosphatase